MSNIELCQNREGTTCILAVEINTRTATATTSFAAAVSLPATLD